MVTLYRDGNTHTINGIECEMIRIEPELFSNDYLDQGWRFTPEKVEEQEQPEEPEQIEPEAIGIEFPREYTEDALAEVVEQEQPVKKRGRKKQYSCHMCGKKITEKNDNVIVQAVTGSVFCSQNCVDKHRESKGF